MKRAILTILLAAVTGVGLWADAPHMLTVSQKTAKPGDVLEVGGVALSSANVEEVYLTDHKFDMRVKVLEQTDSKLRVRVPPFAKPGRMQFMILTSGQDPKLLEQPLYILIEDTNTEISAVKQ